MPRPKSTPGYCRHKASGLAYVTLDGKPVYLGAHGTPESRAAYDRAVGEWLNRGRRKPETPATPAGPIVAVLADRFWQHAQANYRLPDGSPSSELASYKLALRFLNRLYGDTPTADFRPLMLKAVREAMIRPCEYPHPATGQTVRHKGWCRANVNRQVGRLKTVFKWGVEHELVPAAVYQALATVAGLRRGRTEARETDPVKPVAEATVLAVLPFLPPPVAAIVKLELLCGARGGELCKLRGRDLDRGGPVWVYKPAGHKTAHHGKAREIRFGPRAQEVLTPFLRADPDAYLFSPAEAEAGRRAELTRKREESGTPAQIGNRPGTNRKRKPERRPGERYTKDSYARAVARGCDKAFPPPAALTPPDAATAKEKAESLAGLAAWRKAHRFHPHQLRHANATKVRKAFGLEAASIVLGHSSTNMTELYAERDGELADRVMGEVG